MRPINLIPPEDRRGERAPLRTGPLAYVVVGVLILVFVGVYALVGAGNSISEQQARVGVLEQDLEASAARAEALRSFSDFATLEQTRNQTVSDLATSRFDWERVLRELALVVPRGITFIRVAGSIAGPAGDGATTTIQEIESPNMVITGCTTDQETVARLVAALRDIDGVTRVGLGSSGAPSDEGQAVSSGAAVGGASASAEGCGETKTTVFVVMITFDEVTVDAASGGIVTPEAALPDAGDGSGIAEAQADQGAVQDSVESAKEKSQKAVDEFVPGA